jgi:hypothetical protein
MYKKHVASDCITFAIRVLKDAFHKTCNLGAEKRVGNLGEKGTELAKYLINNHGWTGVYYNPDVNHSSDGSGEHISSPRRIWKYSSGYQVLSSCRRIAVII